MTNVSLCYMPVDSDSSDSSSSGVSTPELSDDESLELPQTSTDTANERRKMIEESSKIVLNLMTFVPLYTMFFALVTERERRVFIKAMSYDLKLKLCHVQVGCWEKNFLDSIVRVVCVEMCTGAGHVSRTLVVAVYGAGLGVFVHECVSEELVEATYTTHKTETPQCMIDIGGPLLSNFISRRLHTTLSNFDSMLLFDGTYSRQQYMPSDLLLKQPEWLANFNAKNPTGRYTLDLSDAIHYSMAMHLILLDRWERTILAWDDLSNARLRKHVEVNYGEIAFGGALGAILGDSGVPTGGSPTGSGSLALSARGRGSQALGVSAESVSSQTMTKKFGFKRTEKSRSFSLLEALGSDENSEDENEGLFGGLINRVTSLGSSSATDDIDEEKLKQAEEYLGRKWWT